MELVAENQCFFCRFGVVRLTRPADRMTISGMGCGEKKN
jgi:hypothetical protein